MPSTMLEQEAQMFGLRERAFPASGIGSPQHLQIREFMRSRERSREGSLWLVVNPPDKAGIECCTLSSPDTANANL
jgi:hypothetical protein